jgi:hypothetical protein
MPLGRQAARLVWTSTLCAPRYEPNTKTETPGSSERTRAMYVKRVKRQSNYCINIDIIAASAGRLSVAQTLPNSHSGPSTSPNTRVRPRLLFNVGIKEP